MTDELKRKLSQIPSKVDKKLSSPDHFRTDNDTVPRYAVMFQALKESTSYMSSYILYPL